MARDRLVSGTTLFDGTLARRGYALNAMCFSPNDESNRREFLADEDAYLERYGLTVEQRDAVGQVSPRRRSCRAYL